MDRSSRDIIFSISQYGKADAFVIKDGIVGIGTTDPSVALEVKSGRINDKTGAVTPVGVIMAYMASSEPTGWLFCDGRAVSRTTYADLFAIIGTTCGSGDGSTTFNLPNLTGRVLVGKSADTEFDNLAETGGAKTHTLTTTEMPTHTHTYSVAPNVHVGAAIDGSTNNGNWGSNTSYATGEAGGGGAHNNLQPYIVVNYIIKY